MTRNEIIEMARQTVPPAWLDGRCDYLEAFAKLVAEREREECAKLCESIYTNGDGAEGWLNIAADKIRARQ